MLSKKVFYLMGPTASGKTVAAIELHKKLGMEVVSVDSAMVYKGMDIGTAKPSLYELAECPHRLIDFLDPSTPYSAADFIADAKEHIEDIFASGKVPLLVGGTMLYFRSLENGLSELPDANQDIRSKIEAEAKEKGWPELHSKLQKIDLQMAVRLSPNDSQRIERALEVYEITGKPMSQLLEENRAEPLPYEIIKVALQLSSRETLHERIRRRFMQMLEQGFVSEVEALMVRGDLDMSLPSVRSVGYRQVWQYLQQEMTYEEMIERAVIATRQLAKRQLTWLKTEQNCKTIVSDNENYQPQICEHFEKFIN
ncbi:MAG: tRNA (adenosine(37)-N6)-dimethylallyltransferase MiaA [Gammaproteobacteria bacterium]|nr:MAG: tRNA (adenosine(37)-N6)-dimethylallyltransferase MiaA [Gammaproteobacteria bacterium]